MRFRHFQIWFASVASLTCATASAQTNFFSFSVEQGIVNFSFQTNGNPNGYYVLESSTNLLATFAPVMISLAPTATGYQTSATNAQEFFSPRDLSIYAPQASLGDGIDDVFKLNSGLDPLGTNVAGSFSGHYATNGAPLTWLQYYNQAFGRYETNRVVYGRAYSVFNFGAPFAKFDAHSREVSLLTIETPDAVSRTVSVYNGGAVPTSADVVSRSVSTFNAPPIANVETVSRQVSVRNTAL